MLPPILSHISDEILLLIFSYLDLPDLSVLTHVVPELERLTSDPVLHNHRIRIISPSRVNHSLFGTSPEGHPFRPSIVDLVHRGVLRGLAIERRWRTGAYFNSRNSVIQYENSRLLARRHAILPDVESSSPNIARALLPVVRKLKWSLQRDRVAKALKNGWCGLIQYDDGIGTWVQDKHPVVLDGEKVRLAICPDIKKKVVFYETLANP
ncbi:hypothetical protein BDQ17DRAFT_1536297 [Cyathus striatus]|nr:hypothetical protein BDQ17DRAFT_1536297 [Cyathus striatus]